MKRLSLAVVLSSIVCALAYAASEEGAIEGFGPCPPGGPCWSYISTAFFRDCCAPYHTVTKPTQGKGYLALSEDDYKKYQKLTVLSEATLTDPKRRNDIEKMLRERGEGLDLPWYMGPLDEIGFGTFLGWLDALDADMQTTVRDVAATMATGGTFQMVIVTGEQGGERLALKGIVYRVKVGAETRSTWIGGSRTVVRSK